MKSAGQKQNAASEKKITGWVQQRKGNDRQLLKLNVEQ